MEDFFSPVMLSRLQFAVTTLFHILWPLLSVGLSLFMVITEAAWLKTGNELYYRHTRFWAKLFLLSFGLGVASGLPLEFEFGTNWARFSRFSGGFFGNILGFEGAMAFMLEAAFFGVSMFAWNRVSRRVHLFATAMVAAGASLSAFWIMDANAWMQTPAGVAVQSGQIVVTDYAKAIFNPAWFYSFSHMWVACVETSLFFVAGISAWYLRKDRHREFFLKSFKTSVAAAVIVAPLQVYLGDLSARGVAIYQPAKTAAMEAHWQTNPPGQGAGWIVVAWPDEPNQKNVWELRIPYLLSLLIYHTPTAQVQGLRDIPPQDRPPVLIPFYSFRLMTAIGLYLAALVLWALWKWRRGQLRAESLWTGRGFWLAWVWAAPLGFIASDLGWATREVGRQPWVVQGLLRTSDGVSTLSRSPTAATLALYTGIYLLLLVLFVVFTRRILQKGPDLTSPLPARQPEAQEGTPA
ncbi:MAG: cytochrome ubiquinol oxidase subunit I [Phycisphaerae bacterium]|jgi:cytochrome d ubiquinol oxidase subunit I